MPPNWLVACLSGRLTAEEGNRLRIVTGALSTGGAAASITRAPRPTVPGSPMRLLACLLLLAVASPALAQGELLESRESIYNNIYVRKAGDQIIMQFGKNTRYWTESVYDTTDDRALPVTYTRYMTVALAYPEEVGSVLEIGLGGGRTAAYMNLHMPDTPITSVELDPDVVELAEKYFNVRQNDTFKIETRDGRIHLVRARGTHDVIMVDAYRGPFVPFHLLTKEFYLTAKRRLNPGGILAQNIEPTTMLFDAALATLYSVFDHIDLYQAGGNVVAVAYDGEAIDNAALMARAAALQQAHEFAYPLPALLEERRIVTRSPDHDPLIDDFAPVEMLKSIERHNQGIDDISKPAD